MKKFATIMPKINPFELQTSGQHNLGGLRRRSKRLLAICINCVCGFFPWNLLARSWKKTRWFKWRVQKFAFGKFSKTIQLLVWIFCKKPSLSSSVVARCSFVNKILCVKVKRVRRGKKMRGFEGKSPWRNEVRTHVEIYQWWFVWFCLEIGILPLLFNKRLFKYGNRKNFGKRWDNGKKKGGRNYLWGGKRGGWGSFEETLRIWGEKETYFGN